jgi:hypothetical protein
MGCQFHGLGLNWLELHANQIVTYEFGWWNVGLITDNMEVCVQPVLQYMWVL